MRDSASDEVFETAAGFRVRVDSCLGGDLLAANIPVSGGSYILDSTTQTLESATVVVPYYADGRSWVPAAEVRHPLGRFGQELVFTAVVTDGSEDFWETDLGRVRIQEWYDDGNIVVECEGVMRRAADSRFSRRTTPRKDGTLASELVRIMPGGIPVMISDDLTDRACPSTFEWDEDRISAIYDIIDAWPALIKPDGYGGVEILPELNEAEWSSVYTFHDGDGGTAASAPRSDTRERVYNRVIARAETDDADAPLVQGQAKITSGEYSVTGPYGDVPRFYSSPLLKTQAECQAAAAALLAKSQRPARVLDVVAAVDPRFELFDPVTVEFDGVEYRGWIIGIAYPLTHDDDMVLTVSIFYAF